MFSLESDEMTAKLSLSNTLVWHHYPDISLLLIFYRELKFEVRFFLGPLV